MNETENMNADEKELVSSLRALARDEAGLGAGPHVEAQLMRAWDETRGVRPRRGRIVMGPFLKMAAALVLATSAAYWWSRDGARAPLFQELPDQPTVKASWPSSETLVWLDPEPASLQIVHVRVASGTLAAQGYALSDPDGDGLVDLEVVLAADGTARGVRVAPATLTIQ